MTEQLVQTERAYFIRGQRFAASPLEPGLYVVATPIGHLSDITIRALDTLAGVDLIAAEDTRVTRKLLTRYGIETRMTSYHEHSDPKAERHLLRLLAEGGSVALVSDAGTPLISDPGERLVAKAVAEGCRVVPIPGPSSAIAALSAAGIGTETFLFLGFLPSKTAARRKRLEALATTHATLVLFESPNRVAALLEDAVASLGGERHAALAREITKLHETFDRGALADLAARYSGRDVKGEIVLAIAPPSEAKTPAAADVDAMLAEALRSASVKEAAALVSEATGLSRRDLYQRALALRAAVGKQR
jgi:16S rRNA (cytidine1402-2'-O)-methyltransferase